MYKIICVIPTYNGQNTIGRLLESLDIQTISFDKLIIDSSSTDKTRDIARDFAVETLQIPNSEFNHGGTRQMIVDLKPNYDIYIYLTQDAYLADKFALVNIVQPFSDPKVGAVCGRQLPHIDASLLAHHARSFNYPEGTQVKSFTDVPRLGIKTVFLSNSFSAYRGVALNRVGGFPTHVIFAEDMYVAAKLILADWSVAYVGNAECYHSHNYTVMDEFRRYFDMGVFHAREPWISKTFGGAGSEGLHFVKSELRFLGFRWIYLWPEAFLRNIVKLIGYKLGQYESVLPVALKKSIGMHATYWIGPFALQQEMGVDKK